MNTIALSKTDFLTKTSLPEKAFGWLESMAEGDTFILGKCVVSKGRHKFRAQAIIQKTELDWSYSAIWQFPEVYEPANIYSTGSLSLAQGRALIPEEHSEDFSMFLEVVKRIEIHGSTLSVRETQRYLEGGFRPLYSCVWIGDDNITKSVQLTGESETPTLYRFKPSFIDVVMDHESSTFDYFSNPPKHSLSSSSLVSSQCDAIQ